MCFDNYENCTVLVFTLFFLIWYIDYQFWQILSYFAQLAIAVDRIFLQFCSVSQHSLFIVTNFQSLRILTELHFPLGNLLLHGIIIFKPAVNIYTY